MHYLPEQWRRSPLRPTAFLLLLGSLGACASTAPAPAESEAVGPGDETSVAPQAIEVPRSILPILGGGWDSGKGIPMGECTSFTLQQGPIPDTKELGNRTTTFVEIVRSSEEMAKKLEISAAASVGGLGVGVEVAGRFAESVSFNTETVNVLVHVQTEAVPSNAVNVALKPDAAAIYGDEAAFVRRCGDSYLDSVVLGGSFFGVFSIVTAGGSNRTEIEASVKASFPFGSAKVEAVSEFFSKFQKETISSRMMLVGGRPEEQNVPTDLKQFIERAQRMPEITGRNPVPIRYTRKEYGTAAGTPRVDPPLDRAPINVAAGVIAKDALTARDCTTQAQFVLEHPSEFEGADERVLASTAKLRDDMHNLYIDRQTQVGRCVNAPCTRASCNLDVCKVDERDPRKADAYSCTTKLPKRKSIEASIYGRWLAEGGASGALGPMRGARQEAGSNGVFQEFANGAIFFRRPAKGADGKPIEGTGRSYLLVRPIFEKWMTGGGYAGALGYPTNDTTLDGLRARSNDFERGAVYEVDPLSGSGSKRVVQLTKILSHWKAAGAARSAYGYPTGDETVSADGQRSRLTMENGWFLYSSAAGVHSMRGSGALATYYEGLGGIESWLGAPSSDEYAIDKGWAVNFPGKKLFWSSGTGAHAVGGGLLVELEAAGGVAALGFPTTDEVCSHAHGTWGCYDRFEKGAVFWTANPFGNGLDWSVAVKNAGLVSHYFDLGGPARLGYPTHWIWYGVATESLQCLNNVDVTWDGSSGHAFCPDARKPCPLL